MTRRAANIWRGLGTVAIFLVAGPVVGGLGMTATVALADALLGAELIQAREDWFMAFQLGALISAPAALIGGIVMAASSARLASRQRWLVRSALVCAALGAATMALIIGVAAMMQQSSFPIAAFLSRAVMAIGALALSAAALGAACAGASLRLRPRPSPLPSADVFD